MHFNKDKSSWPHICSLLKFYLDSPLVLYIWQCIVAKSFDLDSSAVCRCGLELLPVRTVWLAWLYTSCATCHYFML